MKFLIWNELHLEAKEKNRSGKSIHFAEICPKFEIVCTWNCQHHLKCSCWKIKVFMPPGWTWNDWNSNGWLGNVLIDNVWHNAVKEEGSSAAVKLVSLPRIRLEKSTVTVGGWNMRWLMGVSCLNMLHLFPRGSSMIEEGLVSWEANWGNKFSTSLLIAAVSDTVL